MPQPETDEIGRYLEDTITIDWQTPAVMEQAKSLLDGVDSPEGRVRALYEFVRDEVIHSFDAEVGDFDESARATCRASEVLAERTGLCYAKSHLLAGMLRYAGLPTGFCYVRLVSDTDPEKLVIHGFNAVYWAPSKDWIYLDARGNRPGLEAECRFEAPWSLPWAPDGDAGEAFLPFIYKRPAKRIIDLLERAPDFATVRKNRDDACAMLASRGRSSGRGRRACRRERGRSFEMQAGPAGEFSLTGSLA
jgi:transglutaminase-like putative cysteine protease